MSDEDQDLSSVMTQEGALDGFEARVPNPKEKGKKKKRIETKKTVLEQRKKQDLRKKRMVRSLCRKSKPSRKESSSRG